MDLTRLKNGKLLHDHLQDRKRNNFNLLRLLAAFLVLMSHTMGAGEPIYWLSNGRFSASYFGMPLFFFLSGLLVAQSLERSPSRLNFVWRRICRLYPAAILVVLLTVFVLGPILTTWSLGAYFRDPRVYKYLSTVLLIRIHFFLPGVFENSPLGPGVNNSLWSLSLECKLYAALVALSFIRNRRWFNAVLLAVVLILYSTNFLALASSPDLQRFFGPAFILMPYNRLAVYFGIGILTYRFNRRIVIPDYWLFLLPVAISLSLYGEVFQYTAFLLLPAAILFVSVNGTKWTQRITPKPDLSYGIYIFAFPIGQILLTHGIPLSRGLLFLDLLATIPFALFSWYWVESPALRAKNRFK